MAEGKATSELAERRGIPFHHIIVVVILTWIAFVWAYITRVGAGAKYWTVTGAWIPWIYIVMIAAYIGRKFGKTLDKTLLIAIIFVLGIVTAKWYYFSGTSEVDFINNLSGTFSASLAIGVWPPEASQYIKDLLPSWLVVWDPTAASRYYNGGGEPIWSAYIAPIIAWSLIFISLAFQMVPLSFTLLGPEFYEVERLPFPITIPSRFVINSTYTEDPANFGELFFNMRKYRIFWIAFVVGFLINLPYIVSQILPAVPWGAYIGGGYGVLGIDQIIPNIVEIVQSVFPNAQWVVCTIALVNILVFMLIPYEIATTYLIWLIGIGWVYCGIATRMGLIPVGGNPWWSGPLPLIFIANPFAANLGLGLIVLYLLRRRIRELFTLFSRGGEIGGIPVRLSLSLLILGILMFIAIWSAAGLDPLTSFLLWLFFTITSIGGAYYYAQLFWYGAHCTGYNLWKIVYPVSASLGLLPTVPTPGHRAAAVFGYYTATMGTCVGAFESNSMYNASIITTIYSLGADTKADMRRLFIYVLTALVVLAPFAFFFDAWFNSHVGIANTSQSGMDMHWWNPALAAMDLGVRSITWSAGPMPIHIQAMGFIGWAIFIVICYFITARIPILGYFLNPIGVASIGIENFWCGWVNPLIALIIKYLLTRAVGARRAYEITVEVVAGLAVGFGVLYLILGAYTFFSLSIPTITALWR